ncbi:MAG: class I SAM-dependent methyltransferase [Alphaproteobacteria bacterium]|nr:class I SAM-dependent methyltransferase [Alphaproteobacteria bacterium]
MTEDETVLETDTEIKGTLAAWWNGDDSQAVSPLPALIVNLAMSNIKNFRRKMLLWWNGGVDFEYEISPAEEYQARAQTKSPLRKHQEINARGQVAQALWGEGNLTPGPAAFIQEITHRLGVTQEMSMLDLGAGLGGPARAICEETKVWISAFEVVPEYAKAGKEQSLMHCMGKKVAFTEFYADTVKLPEHKYDCVFSKEIMHHVKDKRRLLHQIQGALKKNGQFFFTNYVITEKGKRSSCVSEWNGADGQESYFWSEEEYKAAFAKCKLDLRVSEDLSAKYCEMIADGFRSLRQHMDALIEEETDPERHSEMLHALAFGTRRWAMRAEALQSGDMALLRFSGLNGAASEVR